MPKLQIPDKTDFIHGHSVQYYDVLPSTNDFLEELHVRDEVEDGRVIAAGYQTEGRGMVGNSWESNQGENVLLSYYLNRIDIHVSHQFYLSKALSLALHDTLSAITKEKDLKIKWPNDVWHERGKLSGILIKNGLRNEQLIYSILGVGINVNQDSFQGDFQASSISRIIDKTMKPYEVMEELIPNIDLRLDMVAEKRWQEIDQLYHTHLLGLHKKLRYKDSTESFVAALKKVGMDGRAEFEFDSGETKSYGLKEISPISVQQAFQPTY